MWPFQFVFQSKNYSPPPSPQMSHEIINGLEYIIISNNHWSSAEALLVNHSTKRNNVNNSLVCLSPRCVINKSIEDRPAKSMIMDNSYCPPLSRRNITGHGDIHRGTVITLKLHDEAFCCCRCLCCSSPSRYLSMDTLVRCANHSPKKWIPQSQTKKSVADLQNIGIP